MDFKTINRLIQLATGSKNITAKELSHFDHSDVISSESFGYRVNDQGEMMHAHFQLRILNDRKCITTIELEYVPVKAGEQYYEIGKLREQRTIYNLPFVVEILTSAGYNWSLQERFWS